MATEFTITNRTINIPVNSDIVVQGDTNSKVITFVIQRYFDGVDLSTKTINVAYENANSETGNDDVVLGVVYENTFTFNWTIQSGLTVKSGTVSIWIEISGTNYLWKTKPKTFTVENSILISGDVSTTDYTIQENFYTSTDNTLTISTSDTSEPIYISGRDILMTQLNDFVICGDNRSQILSFTMDRYFENIDRSTKKIAIAFINGAGHSDRSGIVNRIITDTTITFGWLIDSKVTEKEGIVSFYIEVLGYDENNKFTCWKTLDAQFNVEKGLSVDGHIEELNPSWYQSFQILANDKITQITNTINSSNTIQKNLLLTQDNLLRTTQTVTLNPDETVYKVQHKDLNNTLVREDIYTYNGDIVTETRTLSTGESAIFKYNLSTYQTEII